MLLTRQQIAERLDVSYNHAGDIMKTMPVVWIGKRIRVREEDLEDWLASRVERPGMHMATVTPIDRSVLTAEGRIPRRAETRHMASS